jgi:hypothetical protein
MMGIEEIENEESDEKYFADSEIQPHDHFPFFIS